MHSSHDLTAKKSNFNTPKITVINNNIMIDELVEYCYKHPCNVYIGT